MESWSNNETIHSLASSRNHTGNHTINNVDNYVKEWWRVVNTVKDYEKLSEQYNKMLEERNSLIDDLSWYKAKVSRLERENEKYGEHIRELQAQQGSREYTKVLESENLEYFKENKEKNKLLSEISQHIGNKPSSSTYKYFRAKLDGIGIKEGE